MSKRNESLAQIFHTMADIYRLMGNNKFRAIAYQNASNVIDGLPEDISFYVKTDTLDDIPGIGKTLEANIREYLKTGRIARFEKLSRKVPLGLIELMSINGFGPQSLKTIHEKLKLENKDEVISALQDGRIEKLKGFGPKKVENLLRALKLHKTVEERMLLIAALRAGNQMISELKTLPEVKKVELAGSLRRKKETIGDIDILIAAASADRKPVIDLFTSSRMASKVLARGETKASIISKSIKRQVDLRIVKESEWGSALQYFTGSKEHNIHLRTIAKNKGYKISEYGIFNLKDEKRVAGKTEDEIYETLGMQWMPPEMREDRGEIELAHTHHIPTLIDIKNIRGDLQMHSDWSDGLQTLDDMVNFVRENFHYEYIAITDHSQSSRIAGGMDEKSFLKQLAAVKELNENLGLDFLKAGAEVDILPDGSLDLSDEVLEQLDWVTASIHSGFKKDNTNRIIQACNNPYVHCIGHPTGRLIGKREPYSFSLEDVLTAAKETGTALEINAQPDRMDLNDEMAFEARAQGVKLVISTDSHKPTDYYFMELGVYVARRAWCQPSDILNTLSWSELEKFIQKKRKGMKVST
jgi:DNA polymerase (family 10)